ncbi:MAG: GGDEF domain-containing protein [Treponemataceae bacterium]|nr:GGDEF domain-containing protein [Treponemataceae bacterium]
MKNIAVLIYDMTIEYQITVTNGIVSYFEGMKDVNLFIAPVSVPHAITAEFDYQYWTSTEVLRSKTFDAFIVVANSFTSYYPLEKLEEEFKKFSGKPIISIAVPLSVPNNSYTYNDSKKAYVQIVDHLKNKHNRRKIAFFSAELNRSPEATDRLKAYKHALKVNGLQFNEDLVFPGDFTPATTYRFFEDQYSSKEEIDFDAVVCANDYMAAAAVGALSMLGARVPEDVCVVGYDDSDVAVTCSPTLTTVNQQLELSGKKAAEMAYKAVCGAKIPHRHCISSSPVYRQSCGCVPVANHSDSYYDQAGAYVDKPKTSYNVLNIFGNALNDMASIYHMLNMTESISDINDYFSSFIKNLKLQYFRICAICLYDKVYKVAPEDDFVLPKEARLIFYYNEYKNIERNCYNEGGMKFSPYESIMPPEAGDFDGGLFYVLPVSLRDMNYGYVLCRLPFYHYTVYAIFLKLLTNSFIHCYEYSKKTNQNEKLEELNQELSVQSRTDELTKIFNRRGFMEYAQRLLDLSIVTGAKGSVFFFDLDGLKRINDTWGHKTGDIAIQTCADVLKEAFHKSDIIGRLSGDEFAVTAPGFEKVNEDLLRLRIQSLCAKHSKRRKLPFTLSVSFGIAEFSSQFSELTELLIQADKELYKEKKIKHSQS